MFDSQSPRTQFSEKVHYSNQNIRTQNFRSHHHLKLNKIGYLPQNLIDLVFLIAPTLKTEQNWLLKPDYNGLKIFDPQLLKIEQNRLLTTN